jgi:hypothetical protein
MGYIYKRSLLSRWRALPEQVVRWILNFDRGLEVCPMEFEL